MPPAIGASPSKKYEEAAKLTAGDTTCEWCPAIHFYLGNSYDNMYRPARKGEAANDEFLNKAVENYKIASERADGRDRAEALAGAWTS